jgi:CTP:molybdopterin cytidylyltransferase MocA
MAGSDPGRVPSGHVAVGLRGPEERRSRAASRGRLRGHVRCGHVGGQAPAVSVAAVVLAAGAGTRFGGPKQRLLLPPVLERLRETSVEDVVVVAGAYGLEAEGARVVECPEWERGPGASLRCGLAALARETKAAVVVLADGPELAPEAVARVLAAWRDSSAELVAASYGGVRGHPLLLARALWDAVPDEGLRALAPLLVPCDDLGHPGDVDRVEDLR